MDLTAYIFKLKQPEKLSAEENLCLKYLDHVDAYLNHGKNPDYLTTTNEMPDEAFMLGIEKRAGVAETSADDWRRMLFAFFCYLAMKHKPIYWDFNPTLGKAIVEELLEGTQS